jgi:hypothetical protein
LLRIPNTIAAITPLYIVETSVPRRLEMRGPRWAPANSMMREEINVTPAAEIPVTSAFL